MMRILLILIVFPFMLFAQTRATKPDFRAAQWGMSIPAVKATEPTKPFIDNDTQLMYKNVPVGQDRGELMYMFDENQLSGGAYRFNSPLPSAKAYDERFDRIKSYLISKYGPPMSSTVSASENKGPVQNHSTSWMGRGLTILLTMDNSEGKPITSALFIKGPR